MDVYTSIDEIITSLELGCLVAEVFELERLA